MSVHTSSISTGKDAVSSSSPTLAAIKPVSEVLPNTGYHWVGDGFYVKPVFASKAFTKSVSKLYICLIYIHSYIRE